MYDFLWDAHLNADSPVYWDVLTPLIEMWNVVPDDLLDIPRREKGERERKIDRKIKVVIKEKFE